MLTDKKVRQILSFHLPDLKIREIRFVGEGIGNSVYLINRKFIFRFSKWPNDGSLEKEILLLPKLKDRVNIRIPEYLFSSGKSWLFPNQFVGYRKMKGIQLTREVFDSLPEATHHGMAKTIAAFLKRLHAFPIGEAKKCGVESADNIFQQSRVRTNDEKMFSLLPQGKRQWFIKFYAKHSFASDLYSYEPCLVHDDLSEQHIFFEPGENKISGVIDFGQTKIGDPFEDFRGLLCSYGVAFVKKVLLYFEPPDQANLAYKLRVYNTVRMAMEKYAKSWLQQLI